MKIFHKTALTIAVATIATVVVAQEIKVGNESLDKAVDRAQSAISRVITSEVSVPNQRIVPELPDQGMKVVVPNSNDPVAVAEMMQQKPELKSFNPNLAKSGQLAVFVSMSMPESSLKRIALETARVGGVMVFRGFINESLKDTVNATKQFANLGVEIQINPELFAAYEVKQVPTFVLASDHDTKTGCSKEQACSGFIKLQGDASLIAIFEAMSDDKSAPDLAKLAQAKLGKLKGYGEAP